MNVNSQSWSLQVNQTFATHQSFSPRSSSVNEQFSDISFTEKKSLDKKILSSGALARRSRTSGAPTLENLITHRSQNFRLSGVCPLRKCVLRLFIRPYTKAKLQEYHHYHRCIFDLGHLCYD